MAIVHAQMRGRLKPLWSRRANAGLTHKNQIDPLRRGQSEREVQSLIIRPKWNCRFVEICFDEALRTRLAAFPIIVAASRGYFVGVYSLLRLYRSDRSIRFVILLEN